MSIHGGHRQRMKDRFMSHGLDNFDDHSVLELLLFFAQPRKDVNPIAHALLEHFGSLASVFDASADELSKVDGIGDSAATLIKLIPALSRRYQISKTSFEGILVTTEDIGNYLLPRFTGYREEVVYLTCLDAKNKVISCTLVSKGSVNAAHISTRSILETALNHNATSIILAHNHTSGVALPSTEDVVTTRQLSAVLKAAGIFLKDHLIIGGNDFVSLRDSDKARQIFCEE